MISSLVVAVTVFAATGVATSTTGKMARAKAARSPNIVLIFADDLGYGDLGAYGQKRIRTPRLDALAAEGMRFSQAYAGSTVCAPSRSALMTGQHTGHTFIRGNAKANLRPEDVTFAETLRKAGYATGLFGKWGLGHEGSTGVPTKKGFDVFYGYLDQTHAHNYWPSFLVRGETREPLRNVVPNEGKFGQGVASTRVDYSPDLIMKEALAWIAARRERPEQPFLAVLTPTLPHANNEAVGRGLEIPDAGIYAREPWPENQRNHAAMVTRLDADVGRVIDLLRSMGVERDTLVVFTSDNGPHAEGGNDPEFADSNGPLRGIKRSLYEGGIRVPAIAWWPSRIAAGVSAHPWANWDLAATFAEVAGVRGALAGDGVSIAPVLLGRRARPRPRGLYWEFHEASAPARALRMGDLKLIEHGGRGGPRELYDLARDPGESTDLAHRRKADVARLYARMDAQRTEHPDWPLATYDPDRTARPASPGSAAGAGAAAASAPKR